jgi:hypothetical protein
VRFPDKTTQDKGKRYDVIKKDRNKQERVTARKTLGLREGKKKEMKVERQSPLFLSKAARYDRY